MNHLRLLLITSAMIDNSFFVAIISIVTQLAKRSICCYFITGVILAVLEKMSLLPEFYPEGQMKATSGTVSAGYQNFLICVEMFFGSIALRYAFPHQVRGDV